MLNKSESKRTAQTPRFDFCIVSDNGSRVECRTSLSYKRTDCDENMRILRVLVGALGFELPFTIDKEPTP